MNIVTLVDYEAVSQAVAKAVCEQVASKPNSLICIAAGTTPLRLFEILVSYVEAGRLDLSQCAFVSLDEWIGIGIEEEGSCIQTLYDYFFNKIKINNTNQIHFFNGLAQDLELECTTMNHFIEQHGGLDVCVLGIGMNGHIGFIEPNSEIKETAFVVPLDDVTKAVSVKYFKRPLALTQGITIGIKQMIEAKTLILMASGSHKANIVKATIQNDPTKAIPATLLKHNEALCFYIDEEAATEIEKRS